MKKITLATIKSFAKENVDNLYIKNLSSFDGMADGVRDNVDSTFRKVTTLDLARRNDWGIGVWFVGSSRDYFNFVICEGYEGYEVSNSCGSFVIATLPYVLELEKVFPVSNA